jgi:hypothetical protein
MQLREARLCLDCEEVHDNKECPVCLSEAFAFITRWVPADERRVRRLPSATNVTPVPPDHSRSGGARWLRRGVVGLALVAASRWWWESNRQPPAADGD